MTSPSLHILCRRFLLPALTETTCLPFSRVTSISKVVPNAFILRKFILLHSPQKDDADWNRTSGIRLLFQLHYKHIHHAEHTEWNDPKKFHYPLELADAFHPKRRECKQLQPTKPPRYKIAEAVFSVSLPHGRNYSKNFILLLNINNHMFAYRRVIDV